MDRKKRNCVFCLHGDEQYLTDFISGPTSQMAKKNVIVC